MIIIEKTQKAFSFSTLLLQFFAVILLSTMISPLLHAEDSNGLEEWHYTLRPGDTLPNISLNLLNYKYTWGDVVQHNKIKQLDNLAPGSIIKIPMHWLKHQPKPAKVIALDGSAQIKKASSSRFNILKLATMIHVGDEVATREGNVVIELADGSTIRLEANSNLIFNKLSHFGKTGMVDTRLRLKKGSLTTDMPPLDKGPRYEIKTPSAVAAVRGTEFRLHSSDNETRIEVLEGVVEFSGEHGKSLVQAGQGATIKSDNARIEVINLPTAPQQEYASKTIKTLPATINWDKSKDADSYAVQLTDKNEKRVQSQTQQATSMELDDIQNGDYELAIRGVSKEGYEGADSVSQLSVEINAIKAELIIPQELAVLETKTPEFKWQYSGNKKANKPPLSRLELALDKDFAAPISENDFIKQQNMTLESPLIPGRYFWRVTSLTNSREVHHSEVRQFNIKGLLAPVKIQSVNYLDKQVGLFWSPIPYAEGYILQVSKSRDFSSILKEEQLETPRAHLLLNVGQKYYARVKGIGNELYSSKFGPVQDIFIAPK